VSQVIAGYIAVLGTFAIYAGWLVVRARKIAASVTAAEGIRDRLERSRATVAPVLNAANTLNTANDADTAPTPSPEP
jgi:hypothetical protein